MSRAPDVIMVVRHGARLDAADPTWHLHSPAPYDSPLTFGGWNQSKLLGQRIAALLKSGKYSGGRNGRVRVTMHSSPFLRCLETSIGITAGIAETSVEASATNKDDGARSLGRNALASITEPQDENDSSSESASIPVIEKPLLRVDAFLGEWLSPEYFEQITPPPETPLMLLSAKAELLAGSLEPGLDLYEQPQPGFFPGGWSGNLGADLGLTRQRSNSFSQGTLLDSTHNANHSHFVASPTEVKSSTGYYVQPVLNSAVSSADHIPAGFVAHARDLCLNIDMIWDSSKEPLDWGDGGTLGEEWGDLHRRIRRGLGSLISFYKTSCSSSECIPAPPLAEKDLLVVILVTHSSGCNALIGALTNQPALIDVGQASLTIATKRADKDQYDVSIKASTDHLRRRSQTKTKPAVKKDTSTPPSTTSTRLNRSSSNTRRPSQASIPPPIRTPSIESQPALWGQSSATKAPPARMWSIDKGTSSAERQTTLEGPVLAMDIDSEANSPKVWSDPRAPVKRRWTTNEPTL